VKIVVVGGSKASVGIRYKVRTAFKYTVLLAPIAPASNAAVVAPQSPTFSAHGYSVLIEILGAQVRYSGFIQWLFGSLSFEFSVFFFLK
jgi:hypothetical protein